MSFLSRYKGKSIFRSLFLTVIFLGVTGLLFLSRALFPGAFYALYTPFSKGILWALSWVTGIFPFSVAEFFVIGVIAVPVITLIVLFFRAMLIPREEPTRRLISYTAGLLALASGLVMTFYLFWGMGYGGTPLAERMGLSVRSFDTEELFSTGEWLLSELNEASEKVERDENGELAQESFRAYASSVRKTVSAYVGIPQAPAKPILLSVPLSYTYTTGIFIPYTGESNINTANKTAGLPFVIAHEMAHRLCIAPEDEANFFAFVSLYEKGSDTEVYSALFSAWQYLASALKSADADRYKQLAAKKSAGVKADLQAYNTLWTAYDTTVATVSQSVNDGYLKAQGEDEGIRSYGQMVDLLIAYHLQSTDKE